MHYKQEDLQQLEAQAQRYEILRENALSKLEECPECHQQTQEKQFNSFGIIACLTTWWICGLGICICRCLRSDFCQTCYTEHFIMKGHELRATKVFIQDISLMEQPPIFIKHNKKKK